MKSHIPTNWCSHRDKHSRRREGRLYRPYSTTSMKLEHSTKMMVTIKSSRQICRLYVLKWPLPFLSSLTALLPTVTKGPRLFMIRIMPQCWKISLCLPSDHKRCRLLPYCICSHLWFAASIFLTAATPVFPLTGFLWDRLSSPYHGKTSTQSSCKPL